MFIWDFVTDSVLGLRLTAFLQATVLIAGPMVVKDMPFSPFLPVN